MRSPKIVVATALGTLVALSALTAVAGSKDAKAEKCYGVVKAGKNDCQTSTSACAGTSKADGQKDAWVYLPKGACEKIVGGTLAPKKS